jgi:hypothetical protein
LVMLVTVLATAWLAAHLSRSRPGNSQSSLLDKEPEIDFNVALIETGGSHDEVSAALYYAIGSVPGVFTTMYLSLPRFGIENIYTWLRRRHKLSPYSIQRPYFFESMSSNDTVSPDLIILTSCELDVFAVDTALNNYFQLGPKSQTLVCVMHHIDRFKAVEERVRRWARAGRLRFIALSTHTANQLRKEVNSFGQDIYGKVIIDSFPPVFPVPLNKNPPPSDRLSIAIQGNFEDTRRDYLKTLLEFERMIDELPAPIVSRIHFTLAGDGKKVGVPAKIMPYVSVNFSLDFIPYYNLLHESFALIPAFADEGYYTTKASSSVPASLIANTPIVASQALLESYGYMSHDAIWKHTGESEMTAIYELLRLHFDDHGIEKSSWKVALEERRRSVKKRALELMAQNSRLMRTMIMKQGS